MTTACTPTLDHRAAWEEIDRLAEEAMEAEHQCQALRAKGRHAEAEKFAEESRILRAEQREVLDHIRKDLDLPAGQQTVVDADGIHFAKTKEGA